MLSFKFQRWYLQRKQACITISSLDNFLHCTDQSNMWCTTAYKALLQFQMHIHHPPQWVFLSSVIKRMEEPVIIKGRVLKLYFVILSLSNNGGFLCNSNRGNPEWKTRLSTRKHTQSTNFVYTRSCLLNRVHLTITRKTDQTTHLESTNIKQLHGVTMTFQ